MKKLYMYIIYGIVIGLLFWQISISCLERLENKLMPTFMSMCEIKVNQIVNMCIGDIISMLHEGYEYQSEDFYKVHYDENGNVSLIENNSILIGKLTNDISYMLENMLTDLDDVELELKIFDVLYPEAFDEFGPSYKMQIMKDGYSNVNYKSEMKEISGNQTSFSAFIKVDVYIKILSPLYNDSIVVSKNIQLIDTIIGAKNVKLNIN